MNHRAGAILLLTAALGGCKAFSPSPLSLPADLEDVHTRTIGEVTVSVAILSDEQAGSQFGADLGGGGLQALWLHVRNDSDARLWLIRNTIDPDVYPPDEAAFIVQDDVSRKDFERLRQYFRDEAMHVMLPPGSVNEGFIFLPRTEGGRYVEVRLMRDVYERELLRSRSGSPTVPPDEGWEELRFGFSIPLPDGIFDFERLDTAKTYGDRELPDLDAALLRTRLEELPPCATNESVDRDGDPLNVVIIGDSADVLNSLSRCGWSFTHRITLGSVRRLIGAAIAGDSYPIAPVSDLHLFGRNQDIALQRARRNISQRNHMRLWLAPFLHGGRQVWVGQVSRDIGIKLTTLSPTLTTHVIDPEVDLTREYLLHSLLAEGFVERFGFVQGGPVATREAPALNLTEDPYFTDGLRLVVVLSPDPIPYDRVRSFLWERTADPVSEGQSGTEAEDGPR